MTSRTRLINKRIHNGYGFIYDDFLFQTQIDEEEVFKWFPSGDLEITVVLKNKRRLIYDIFTKGVSYVDENKRDYSKVDENNFKTEFAIKLRNKMFARGYNQETLSELTNISQTTLSRYMNGQRIPSTYNLLKICEALECSPSELLLFTHKR